jgi:hypothetical protein
MGYQGSKGNYDERDRLFQKSFDGKQVNRTEVKKNLDALFGGVGKQKETVNRCVNGHTWIRDFDRKTKCAYCKTLKPADEAPKA